MSKQKTHVDAFPHRLRDAIKANGLTQAAFASEMKVDINTVKSWVRYYGDNREPDLNTLVLIADRLNVTTDYLLGRDDDECLPMKNVAKAIGVSQIAATSLRRYAKRQPEGRNYPLNGLINTPLFDVFLDRLYLFYLQVKNYKLKREHDPSETDYRNGQITLRGLDYLMFQYREISAIFQNIIKTATGFDEAIDVGADAAYNDYETNLQILLEEMINNAE